MFSIPLVQHCSFPIRSSAFERLEGGQFFQEYGVFLHQISPSRYKAIWAKPRRSRPQIRKCSASWTAYKLRSEPWRRTQILCRHALLATLLFLMPLLLLFQFFCHYQSSYMFRNSDPCKIGCWFFSLRGRSEQLLLERCMIFFSGSNNLTQSDIMVCYPVTF